MRDGTVISLCKHREERDAKESVRKVLQAFLADSDTTFNFSEETMKALAAQFPPN